MRNATIDPEDTTISVVAIPDKAVVLESERPIKTVDAHSISMQAKGASQKSYIDEIEAKFGDEKQIAHLLSYSEGVKGEGLGQVARDLYKKGQLKL